MKTPMEAIISTRLKDAADCGIQEVYCVVAHPDREVEYGEHEQEDYYTKEKCFHKNKFGFMFLQRKSTAGMFQKCYVPDK